MFVDTSAIVAILTHEPEADELADLLDTARSRITSPIAVFLEATFGICRKRQGSVQEAEEDVLDFLELARVELVPITLREAKTALDAFSRYGKGRAHPARLNLGDCFRVCRSEAPPDITVVQRRGFRPDRHTIRRLSRQLKGTEKSQARVKS